MNEYRISPPWIHLKTMDQCYIVQKRVGPRKWMNCCEGSDALFFKTKEAAKAYIKKLTDVDRRERAEDGQEHQCPECGRPCSKVGGNLCLKCTAVDRQEQK